MKETFQYQDEWIELLSMTGKATDVMSLSFTSKFPTDLISLLHAHKYLLLSLLLAAELNDREAKGKVCASGGGR